MAEAAPKRDLYSGPLAVAARHPCAKTGEPGGVILIGLAYCADEKGPLRRIRCELSPEDAADLFRSLPNMIKAAGEPA
jgi:hypothetical protein